MAALRGRVTHTVFRPLTRLVLLSFALSLISAHTAFAQAAGSSSQVPTVLVDTVLVTGNHRVRTEVIQSVSGLRRGAHITYEQIAHAIHSLFATGQFSNVEVLAAPVGHSPNVVALTLKVTERPIVASIEFNGLKNLSAGTIKDTVGLTTGTPYDPQKVAQAEAFARNALAKKGIWLKDIGHHLQPVQGMTGQDRLIFDVNEGPRIAVARVDFQGNHVFSAAQLRAIMDTKPEGFLWFRTGKYDPQQLRQDLRKRLPDAYGALGYIDFAVAGDTLIVDPHTGKARLVVKLEEGPQYQLASFDVQGNHRFPSSELEKYFETPKAGLLSNLGLGGGKQQSVHTPFDRTAFDQATQQVRQLYNNYGYLYAQVEPVIQKTTAKGHPAVDVSWQINEGQPAYVNRVNIEGNTYTHDNVIRNRILLLPGDVYSEQLLVQSYKAIQGLGFFDTPLPTPQIQPTDSGNVNITFKVKEKQTGSVNFGTSLGGYGGLSGFIGYDQPNLFGQAKSGHLRWEFGQYTNNFEASYTDPSLFGSLYSGSVSLYSTRNSFARQFSFSQGEFRQTGGSVQFGFPLPTDRWTRATIGYSLTRTTYSQFTSSTTSSLFQLPPGVRSTVTLGLTRNTLDGTLFPTSGTREQFQADFNGGILGGDGTFQKYTLTGTVYVPIGQVGGSRPGQHPVRFTLGLTADMGMLFGNASRFPFDRFWMGGVQFGEELRGYNETTITPLGYYPRNSTAIPLEDRLGDAYLRLSAEYAVRVSNNLSLSLFYDAGNMWTSPSAIDPTRLFRGAGIGVTLVTPFGPLGLDYAYGFDKIPPGWQLHFKLGQNF